MLSSHLAENSARGCQQHPQDDRNMQINAMAWIQSEQKKTTFQYSLNTFAGPSGRLLIIERHNVPRAELQHRNMANKEGTDSYAAILIPS